MSISIDLQTAPPLTSRRNVLRAAALAALGATVLQDVLAQSEFAGKTVRIIVPFTPGSGSDTAARFFGERAGKAMGTSFVVENKPGGNGLITIGTVKGAPADGYTILLGNISLMVVNPVMLKDISYDSVGDFTPVTGLYRGPAVYAVAPNSPIQSLEDLVARAKKEPISVGTYSQGYQLGAAYLASLAGAKFQDIPYKGQAPLMSDLMGDQVQAGLLDWGGAITSIKAGKLRPLAITSVQRHHAVPELKTVRECGYPEYDHYSWVGFFVRKGTPESLRQTLAQAVEKIKQTDEARRFADESLGGELMLQSPAEITALIQQQIQRFKAIAKQAGIAQV
ncbi:Bug family tripartite tricarboxylate transporter substrate binding protein [Diaphorobacter caeni]|uniref:Bug family tripartite tricarboxylate transporter substrate binding protein n=1 Tax=Diaphorobacter caeni TaxID=2784387 RepID=UPI00188FE068|nr:tripartite tricarboxylate transporter substrate binding protein [Diaphorobacter caeni]MBF5006550.1 tripartite tricarboxylate transporter substrate binding protein [Diaphorobacter caeni]